MSVSKIKICHIVATLGFGGAEKLLADLISHMDSEKFENEVLCLIDGGPFERDLEALGVLVTVLPKKGKLGLAHFWRVRNFLLKSKPDIVHTHLFAGDFWGRIGAYLAGIKPIISTEHNVNVSEGWIKDYLKRQTNKLANKIIAVSAAVKNYAIKKYKLPEGKVEVIYNAIDLDKFNYRQPDFSKTEIIFGNIGRLTQQKGQRYLIQAFSQVVEKIPQAQLWFVGEGELEDELLSLVDKLSLTEKVKFLGVRKNISELMQQFDIFVMPSIWEGLGIVVLEAMASGVPVIASRVDGINEIVTDRENGFLVASKNVNGLAEKMIELAGDQDLANKFSWAGRELVEDKFELNKMVEKYEQLYLKILEN